MGVGAAKSLVRGTDGGIHLVFFWELHCRPGRQAEIRSKMKGDGSIPPPFLDFPAGGIPDRAGISPVMIIGIKLDRNTHGTEI